MKRSYVVCRYCHTVLYPADVGCQLEWYPTNNAGEIEALKNKAKQVGFRCPSCGGRKWIRKVASKVV